MEWISVEDRLPKDYEDVLLACYNDDAYDIFKGENGARRIGDNGVVYTICAYRVSGSWMIDGDEISGTATHWMPLPEPPEAGE